MTNELIPASPETSVSRYGTDDVFKDIASASVWLPRLQLFGANSEPVKEGKFPMAHYGLVIQTDQIEDLGPEVDIIPINWRPKAMKITEGNAAPLSYFDPKSPEFLEVQKLSEIADSGCMFGPEFLVYIPVVKRFATYFMSSKTSRRQAPELRALMRRGVTLKVNFIKTARYSWHGPIVTICNGQLPNIPSVDEVNEVEARFNNPEASSIEFNPEKLEEGVSPEARAR